MRVRHIAVAVVIGAMLAVQAAIPAAAQPPPDSSTAFDMWWARWDRPVEQHEADRSWTWGALIEEAPGVEPYAEGTVSVPVPPATYKTVTGQRAVRYYDKGRMEFWPDRPGFHPSDNLWRVTTGLLATELMTGRLQLGNTKFEQYQPSQVPVAGDPDSGDLTPSYADMGRVMDYNAIPTGWTIIQTIDANGSVGAEQRFAKEGVTAQDVGAPTHHTVASVFWAWMNQIGVTDHFADGLVTERVFPNPFYATGYPTTEAYWTRARVGGVAEDVLVQCFERRCLTYTPSNAPQWQVEMGNIGQHYYHWRYTEIPAEGQ